LLPHFDPPHHHLELYSVLRLLCSPSARLLYQVLLVVAELQQPVMNNGCGSWPFNNLFVFSELAAQMLP
jgi:hypothetical protein